ncbi:MAG TPA: DUF6807 family protein [Pirellulales bacterium]|nr:DUF6807 family protein [Pirellulales bacterium]
MAAISLMECQSVAAQGEISFATHDDRLTITVGGEPFAVYAWRDGQVRRPYFAHLHAPGRLQVTRNFPPREGQDAPDHATMHPGLWLAFGDISAGDFWRNQASVEHVEFVEKPLADGRGGGFAVRNRYVADGKPICDELCRIHIEPQKGATLLSWDSQFSGSDNFYFGDQEEMGLGVRVATALAVKNGGRIVNSDGLENEAQVWGKPANWCNYGGAISGRQAGVLLMADPRNFRRSWFHARDYGLLVANPFGQKAFTGGLASQVTVSKGDTLRLRFAVLFHAGEIDPAAAYCRWQSANY